MPELPEVEIVTRVIRPGLRGRVIQGAVFHVARQVVSGRRTQVTRSLIGQKVADVRRRGKNILVNLDDGVLVFHLGMTGTMYIRARQKDRFSHERVHIALDNGNELVLRDPRTFGKIMYLANGQRSESLDRLGWEPLSSHVTVNELRQKLANRSMGIKAVLLDQALWAGIGNIYASEILWEARVNPLKPAKRLTVDECERIIEAVPRILSRALKNGGSSIRNFMSPDGQSGAYQKQFRVYDRDDRPCVRCGTRIIRVVQAQRSTYYCPKCQKMR
jgi:formamidopyrimidine-DNA glycosylase